MRNTFTLLTFIVLQIFLINSNLTAQWSTDPGTNLMICDTAGEQALAKIAMTSDAGCFISWFDTRAGAYYVYLQRLDPYGNKMWAPNGLLISNNPQDTWLTDYDLIADHNDNALLVFSDIRSGGDLKPIAYKISPAGDFLWGENGIDISTNDNFQPSPKVTETSDGNFVFSWITLGSSNQGIALQKLSADGQKLWGSVPVVIQSTTENYSYPDIVESDNDQAILIYTINTGSYPFQTKIAGQKFDINGQLLWGSSGIMIQDNGDMAFFQVPYVISDHNNGAFISWYDDRDGNMLSSSFVQRISSEGNIYFSADGAEGSLSSTVNMFYPQVAFDPNTQETYMFWVETDYNQVQNGITGQKFSATGDRLWGSNGMVFVPLSPPNTISLSDICTYMGNDMNYVFYFQSGASGLNSSLIGFSIDANGNFLWPGDFVTLSNATQEKMQLVSAVDIYKNCKFAWGDQRLDASGIYAQDINPSGQLGEPVTPVEFTSFNASVIGSEVILKWKTATETNNKGIDVERSQMSNIKCETGWEKIGFVGGFGTTTEPKTYLFTDNTVATRNYSYRLKQVDFDGKYKYSNEVEVEINTPAEFSLNQNYPNPFNPTTQISYNIPKDGFVSLKIYNTLGQEVAKIVNGIEKGGSHKVTFNGANLSSGVYYYRIEAGGNAAVKKMMLMK